jgi:hypothetical protein
MGYTHYWYRPLKIPAEIFWAIRLDFERLVLPLADLGVPLAGGIGEGLPVITNDLICFNGVKLCGHPANERLSIPFPAADASGIGPSTSALDESNGLITKIKHRCCNGECNYETFLFPRCLDPDDVLPPDRRGRVFGFTKTAFRPYDIAVTAALLIAKKNLKDQIMVHTDGHDSHWSDAKRICQEVLGYGDWFGIVEEEVEGEDGGEKSSMPTLIEIRPPVLA